MNEIPMDVEYSEIDKKMKIIPIGSSAIVANEIVNGLRQYLPVLQEDIDYEVRPDMSVIGVKDNDVIYIEIGSMCKGDESECGTRTADKEYARLKGIYEAERSNVVFVTSFANAPGQSDALTKFIDLALKHSDLVVSTSSFDYDKLKNGDASLTSVSEAVTEESFSSLSGVAYNGMWGYLPSKHNSTDNTDFLPAPPAERCR